MFVPRKTFQPSLTFLNKTVLIHKCLSMLKSQTVTNTLAYLSVIDENTFYGIDTSIDLGLELLESVLQPVSQVVRGCLLLALVLVKNYQNFFFLRR